MRGAAALAMLCVGLGSAATAQAQSRSVVLADSSPALAAGVRDALTPWGIEVQVVDAPATPGPTMPQNASSARAVAAEHNAQAVVWIAGSDGEYAVWVYDAKLDQVVSRPLTSAPPFDDATAAAIGLTVKVLLRHAEVAPPEERFGATATATTAPLPRRRQRVWFSATSGIRARQTEASDIEPRLGLGVALFPGPFAPFGAQLLVRTGPGISVNDPAFVGHFSDLSLSASAVAKLEVIDRLTLVPAVGVSAHFTRLDGVVTQSQRAPDVRRANLHLEAGGAVTWRVSGALHIGVRFDIAYAARRQTYLVGGEPVLDLPSAEGEAALVVSLPFL